MLYNQRTGYNLLPLKGANPTPPTLTGRILAAINAAISGKNLVQGISGSFSLAVVATITVTVTIPVQPSTNYQVLITPTNLLSTIVSFVTNKTISSFDVTYVAPITRVVAFDWLVVK